MRGIKFIFLFLAMISLSSCIEDDILNDTIQERISINNPINEIQINDTYQIDATFFNNVGQEETTNLTWSSSNSSILSVSNSGLLSALSEGTSTISVSATINGNTISLDKEVTVVAGTANNNQLATRSGVIVTTSSYTLLGTFTLSEIDNSQDLNLQVMDDYRASTNLPGLYIYLSNNPNSISGAFEIGAVTTFRGAHNYLIPNKGINDYKYIVYWCKPFSVKVGHGEIDD